MHFFVGIAVAVGIGVAPWLLSRLRTSRIIEIGGPLLFVVLIGAVIGLPAYPFSDAFVAAFAVSAGVALGRFMPPRFRPFLALLLVLTALDVAQNVAFAAPATPSTASAALDPHLIWLNVRLPLPVGHFNIGFADVILIAAAAENIRRRGATLALSVLPGVIGISLGEALVATLPPNPPAFAFAVSASLVLFLTAGYVLTELAVSQTATKTSSGLPTR